MHSVVDDGLRLCIVDDGEQMKDVVRLLCPPSSVVSRFPLDQLNPETSKGPESILEKAIAVDAILLIWSILRAPIIGALSHLLRCTPAPVIALCSDNPSDHTLALVAGADDAISLPLYPPLLKAKIVAHVRSARAVRSAQEENSGFAKEVKTATDERLLDGSAYHHGPISLDRKARRVHVAGEKLNLTPRQFALLDLLVRNANDPVSRDQILEHVWGFDFDTGTNITDVYIHHLRKVLAGYGLKDAIRTVRGSGYLFAVPPEK